LRNLLRLSVFAFASVFAPLLLGQAQAQPYPSKPVRMIVPQPPGGASDVVARLLGQKLTELWGQNVIIDHRPGAGTVIGTLTVAKAPPDGYTFGMVVGSHYINPTLRKELPYDTLKDFAPLTQLGFMVTALVAHPAFPANDVRGLIALAKAKPNGIEYASLGIGTGTHLAGELLKTEAGINLLHVPYNGSSPAYNDLLAGRVQIGFVLLQSALPHVKSGRLKVLGITNPRRSAAYPEYPTIGETVPGFSLLSMFGFVAPAGTPPEIVQKLSADLVRVITVPEMRQKLTELGIEVVGSKPEEFDSFIRTEIVRWAPVVRQSGAKAD